MKNIMKMFLVGIVALILIGCCRTSDAADNCVSCHQDATAVKSICTGRITLYSHDTIDNVDITRMFTTKGVFYLKGKHMLTLDERMNYVYTNNGIYVCHKGNHKCYDVLVANVRSK